MEPTAALPLDPLVTAAAGGDREAFADLVDRTRTLVCSIAMAILRDVELSQDVAQDVFLAAWRDLRKLREPASFLPWLRQMTRNRAHHVLRSRVRQRRVLSDRDADDLLDVATDGASSPATALIAQEDQLRLARAIDELPDEAREVVTLFYREGRSVRQVADLLGMREDAVKQRLSRARQRLRDSMLDEIGETLRATAPGAAFTAGVMTLTLGAPTTAAAAAGASLTAKAAGAGLLGQIAYALLSAAPGMLFGGLGVMAGLRPAERAARDDQERAELKAFKRVSVTAVLLFGASLPLVQLATGVPEFAIVSFALFIATLGYLYLVRMPRITARRLALELIEDPTAAARHRRDRILCYGGFLFGALSGTAGLIYGLMNASGH